MNRRQKALTVLAIPFVLGFLVGFLVGGGCSRKDGGDVRNEPAEDVAEVPGTMQEIEDESPAASAGDDVDAMGESTAREVIYYAPRMSYSKIFADLNDRHLEVAKRTGLKQIPRTREDVGDGLGLVRISDSDCYVVDDLRYSVPYLTKGAARELDNIARAFRDSLRSKNLLDYKLIVSSILRTEEDVAKLRRSGNPNASDNSAHCYGTTFDITYTRYYSEDESEAFMQPYELTKVLGEVLRDERDAGRCIVKYERKEHCFHITSCLEQ